MLEAGDEVEGLGLAVAESVVNCWLAASGRIGPSEERVSARFGFGAEVVEFDVAQDGRLDSGEGKQEAGIEIGNGRCARAFGARRLSV